MPPEQGEAPAPAPSSYQGDPVNDRSFQASLLDSIMGGQAPEDEEQEAPAEKATPAGADEPVDEQVEEPAGEEPVEEETEPAEPAEAEEDEVEFEGDDGKPARVKLSELLEAYQSRGKAPKIDDATITAKAKEIYDREAAPHVKALADASAKWVEKAEQWAKWTGEPKPPRADVLLNPDSEHYDPPRYERLKYAYERNLELWNSVQADIKKVKEDAEKKTSTEFASMKERETRSLVEKWPEFAKDAKVREAFVATAQKYGYTADEIGNLVDHRQFLAVRDLIAYNAMKSAKGAEAVKKKIAPKLVKAAARTADAGSKGGKMPDATRAHLDARKKVAKTGKIQTPAEAAAFWGDTFKK